MNYLFFQFDFFCNNIRKKKIYTLDSNFMKCQNIIPR